MPHVRKKVPAFDAANIVILNPHTILYLISISGNWHGYVALSEVMARFHGISVLPVPPSIYKGTHLDSTFCVLSDKKIRYCKERITLDQVYALCGEHGYPDKLNNYICVEKDDVTDVGLVRPDQNFASTYIGMNLLALTPEKLIVEESQKNLIAKLEGHGFKILTVAYPHMRSMGGGIHCTTLPLDRDLH